MIFEKYFSEIFSECSGTKGIAIMGKDGIAVEQQSSDQFFEELLIEFSDVTTKAISIFDSRGELTKQQIFLTEKNLLFVESLSDYYSLFVLADSSVNIGKLRFVVRKKAPWIKKELQ
jgi:predicted regulator of Ras-like GTPase activity (Roadblock/LC7/MglB family)